MNINIFKSKKTISSITIILGIIMIVSGIILMSSSNSHTGSTNGLVRASTSIEFGGDYYTTAAQGIGLAANAACDTYSLIKICFSLVFIFSGSLVVLKESNHLLEANEKNENIADIVEKTEVAENESTDE